jgi:hypothetical protein
LSEPGFDGHLWGCKKKGRLFLSLNSITREK